MFRSVQPPFGLMLWIWLHTMSKPAMNAASMLRAQRDVNVLSILLNTIISVRSSGPKIYKRPVQCTCAARTRVSYFHYRWSLTG
ncbi:hypothetical protein V8D89_002760 [Ganoderma adspersum]